LRIAEEEEEKYADPDWKNKLKKEM